jgi:hypothetical protein
MARQAESSFLKILSKNSSDLPNNDDEDDDDNEKECRIQNEFQRQWNVLEKVKVAWLKRPEPTSVRDKIQSCECLCLAEGLRSMGDNAQGVGSVQGFAGVACSVG